MTTRSWHQQDLDPHVFGSTIFTIKVNQSALLLIHEVKFCSGHQDIVLVIGNVNYGTMLNLVTWNPMSNNILLIRNGAIWLAKLCLAIANEINSFQRSSKSVATILRNLYDIGPCSVKMFCMELFSRRIKELYRPKGTFV